MTRCRRPVKSARPPADSATIRAHDSILPQFQGALHRRKGHLALVRPATLLQSFRVPSLHQRFHDSRRRYVQTSSPVHPLAPLPNLSCPFQLCQIHSLSASRRFPPVIVMTTSSVWTRNPQTLRNATAWAESQSTVPHSQMRTCHENLTLTGAFRFPSFPRALGIQAVSPGPAVKQSSHCDPPSTS